MEMITDYVPGAYMTHDMLHMRGGHQTSWLIDGIAIPNTKIASNVGPQIDPKDIDSLETQRGSYASDIGDRTYGVFNVLPRNGFEFNRDGEFLLAAGNLGAGEAQVSLGNHSAVTAWYASLTGSRSNYGLATPVPQVLHDSTSSQSGFVSLIRNQTPQRSTAPRRPVSPGPLSVPLRPQPQRLGAGEPILRVLRLTRCAGRARRLCHRQLDSHLLSHDPGFLRALLPRQPVQLRFVSSRQSGFHNLASGFELCRRPSRSARSTLGPNNFSAGVYTFYQAETISSAYRSTTAALPRNPIPQLSAGAALVEFYVSDHLRLGQYVTLLGGERFSSLPRRPRRIRNLSPHRRNR